jgi:aminopeptidase-like protein
MDTPLRLARHRGWNALDAHVKENRGELVIEFRRHNLHLVSYRARLLIGPASDSI